MKRKALPTIKGVKVDCEALLRMAHRCVPGKCEERVSCCASYEVTVNNKELSRIVNALARAAAYQPQLQSAPNEFENVFEEVENGEFALDTDDQGLCRFAYRGKNGALLCSLHSAALELGQPPERVKPTSCALWPLALSEDRPPVLSVQEDAFRFACNRRRPVPKGRALHAGVADIVRSVFGEDFLADLEQHLRDG